MSSLVVAQRCSFVDCSLCEVVEAVLIPPFDMYCEELLFDIESGTHSFDVHSSDIVAAVEHIPIQSVVRRRIH